MIFTLSIGVLWAIADYDEEEIIHVTIGNITVSVEDSEEVADSDDLGEVAQESDDEDEEFVNDNELIETEWEWSLPPFEFDAESPQIDQDVLRLQRPTLTREFAIEMRDRLNEEISQVEIMPRKMAQMVQLEMNNLEIYNLEITERLEFDETIFDETADVEDQIRAPFYTIWMCPFDSSNIAFDDYGYQIAPYLLRNQVVFNQATGEYMWNNFVIDFEDMRYFRELSVLFERRKSVQTNDSASARGGLARFSAFGSTIVGERPIIDIFPDPRLAQEIANSLNKTINCPVTEGRLRDISWLSIRGGTPQIQSLEGMQYLNVSWLELIDQNISDLEPLMGPLSGSNLWWLTLDHNQISELSPLEQLNLSGLSGLDLNHNQISDLSPLEQIHFPNLFDLHLNHNQISDLSPLSNMTTLTTLSLNNNLISDPSPLSSLFGPEGSWIGLMWVNLRHNQISNLRLSMLHSGVWIDASNQTFMQPQSFTNPLSVVTKNVTDHNRQTVEMFPITPGGIPDVQGTGITWSWNDVYQAPESVSYGWSQDLIWGGRNIGTFGGTVTVPISDRPMPLGIIENLFPDTRLAQSVVTMLNGIRAGGRNGWTLGCSVAQSQLNLIPFLDVNPTTLRISSLEGMQHLHGLTRFTATGHDISDLSPLSTLTNLTSLTLSNNQISDLAPLSSMLGLRSLNLSNNEIVSVLPLNDVRVRQLQILNLSHNNIASLNGIHQLNNLTSLVLNDNQINDMLWLINLRGVPILNLSNNNITNVQPLTHMPHVRNLNLSNNRIIDLNPLWNHQQNLLSLNLSKNDIENVGGLMSMSGLRTLDLSDNRVSYLRPLSGLTNLNDLNLSNNQVSNLEPLAGLTNLWRLNLSNNEIVYIDSLPSMAWTSDLDLSNNEIYCVKPLYGSYWLWHLNLRDNNISDISPLANVGDMWIEILLCRNQIYDISPLSERSGNFEIRQQWPTQRILTPSIRPPIIRSILQGLNNEPIWVHSSFAEISFNPTTRYITFWGAGWPHSHSWAQSLTDQWGWPAGFFSGTMAVEIMDSGASDGEIELNTASGRIHNVTFTAKNVLSPQEITIKYDADLLEVYDLCAFTFRRVLTAGHVAGTNVEITEFNSTQGIIRFRVNNYIPAGKAFSGVLNIIRFRGRTNGTTRIYISEGGL